MHANMKMLEALTSVLPKCPSLGDIVHMPSNGTTTLPECPICTSFIKTEYGPEFKQWSVFNQDSVSIFILQGKKGALCYEHVHENSIVYNIVTRGKITVIKKIKDVRKLKLVNDKAAVGDCVITQKGIPHKIRIDKDATFLVISIPADPNMPDGPIYEGIKNV